MPISQKTILAIYGNLCELADACEVSLQALLQPDLLDPSSGGPAKAETIVRDLRQRAYDAQREAISAMLADDPTISVNPLTGHLD